MRMLVLTTMENGAPHLPPMDAEDGVQLHEVIGGKIRDQSGYSGLGQIPGTEPQLAAYVVDTSEATCDEIVTNWVEFWEVLDA